MDLPPLIDVDALTIINEASIKSRVFSFRDESILGTRMNLLLVSQHATLAHIAATAIRREIDRFNAILNSRDPNSELFQLNTARQFYASEILFNVIAAAESWQQITSGAFSGRLGLLIDLWNQANNILPERQQLIELAGAAANAKVELDYDKRVITRPAPVKFTVDAFAKGWIIDQAYLLARSFPGINGALVDIGGDIRCGGQSPNNSGWPITIVDPKHRVDNAQAVAHLNINDGAVATSGCGIRDYSIGGKRYSTTLSPNDGWPVDQHLSATVMATTAAEADALATSLLVENEQRGFQLADSRNATARITKADNTIAQNQSAENAATIGKLNELPQENNSNPRVNSTTTTWHQDWQALATFTAPRRQLERDPYFRSPYMAMWLTDVKNNPVRTLILVGTFAGWQKDNFIWWSMNRRHKERLIDIRSMSTSGAGVYNVFWDGVDDEGKPVAPGTYVLHVETSRERGKHTYRSLTLDFSEAKRFTEMLEPTEEGGGLKVTFDHY